MSLTSSSEARRIFPQTQWTLVLAAARKGSPESAAALEAICGAYWYPLYAYVRRRGHSSHDAQDLTQAFFCRLLDKDWLETADREKGKLRTFLITALKHFMSNEWRKASAQRRGGGRTQVPFDAAVAETRYAAGISVDLAADETFDLHWALTLLDLTLNRLRAESMRGKAVDFDTLKNCLMAQRGDIDYAAVARQLCVNEGSARVAVHRLRKRFREIYREELLRTVADRNDLDGELRYLAAVLAGKSESRV